MLTLGVSTSGRKASAGVSRGGDMLSFVTDESGASYSKTLMGLIERSVREAEVELTDIEAIAVDVGPGSFTGVRIGVSCANAMAAALGIPVIPVSSPAALRHQCDTDGFVCTLIDCRNGNCYAALYEGGRETIAPCAAVTEEFTRALPEGTRFVGDCLGRHDIPDAGLVLIEAYLNGRPEKEAVPMYLRPSQAERMKGTK